MKATWQQGSEKTIICSPRATFKICTDCALQEMNSSGFWIKLVTKRLHQTFVLAAAKKAVFH